MVVRINSGGGVQGLDPFTARYQADSGKLHNLSVPQFPICNVRVMCSVSYRVLAERKPLRELWSLIPSGKCLPHPTPPVQWVQFPCRVSVDFNIVNGRHSNNSLVSQFLHMGCLIPFMSLKQIMIP